MQDRNSLLAERARLTAALGEMEVETGAKKLMLNGTFR